MAVADLKKKTKDKLSVLKLIVKNEKTAIIELKDLLVSVSTALDNGEYAKCGPLLKKFAHDFESHEKNIRKLKDVSKNNLNFNS